MLNYYEYFPLVLTIPLKPVATMLQFRLYNGESLPTGLEGFLKAGANIGSVIGQFLFGKRSISNLIQHIYSHFLINLNSGYLADSLGRSKIYGKELMLIIIATILTLTTPTGALSPEASLIYLTVFRILLGVGVGGDYPMSATVASDRASIRRRGTLLAYVFANQGWGSFGGSLVVICVLAAYKGKMGDGTSGIDGGMFLFLLTGTFLSLTLPPKSGVSQSVSL